MGSFAMTCAVSGLPIEAGTRVRYLLLSQNPYNRGTQVASMRCYPWDNWFPRTYPLTAEYNDYGGVENLQKGIQRELWSAAFRQDLVELGWGDNRCHDVPTDKSMPLDQLLEAIREGRVFVEDKFRPSSKPVELSEYADPRIPTRKRVEAILRENGFWVLGETKPKKGFAEMLVDAHDTYSVRVREADYSPKEDFFPRAVAALGKRFATIVTAGSGRYAHQGELLVMAKPASDLSIHDDLAQREKEAYLRGPLAVSHAMIREDVWQALLGIEVTETYGCGDPPGSFKRSMEKMRAQWEPWVRQTKKRIKFEKDIEEFEKNPPKPLTDEEKAKLQKRIKEDIARRAKMKDLPKEVVPYEPTVELRSLVPGALDTNFAWHEMGRRADEDSLKDGEAEAFIRVAAEFDHVSRLLHMTRYEWRPSQPCGPQFGEFHLHAAVNHAFAVIAKNEFEKQERERAE